MPMPKAPAAGSDREELEKRIDSIEKPSASVIVVRFMLACLDRVDGAETSIVDIFRRYERWSQQHHPLAERLDMQAFAEQFTHRCRKAGFEMRRIETLYCVGLALTA